MIDYLLKFTNEAEAQVDPVIGKYWTSPFDGSLGSWRGDCCLPGAMVWQPSQDTVIVTAPVQTTDPTTGAVTIITPGYTTTTHSYLPYWCLTISLDADDAALRNNAACVLAVDWSVPRVIGANFPAGTTLDDFQVSPVFAGRDVAVLLAK